MTLYERGIANGVPVELLEPARLRDFEPHARALRAIHSPSTAIVDYGEVADAIARELRAAGVAIETGARVTAIGRTGAGLELATPRLTVRARRLVNCAGLYSDVVARLAGARTEVRIIPFRGEYYMLRPERRSLVDDFRIVAEPDAIHVLNAPSPAATASLAIGRHIAELAAETFGLG